MITADVSQTVITQVYLIVAFVGVYMWAPLSWHYDLVYILDGAELYWIVWYNLVCFFIWKITFVVFKINNEGASFLYYPTDCIGQYCITNVPCLQWTLRYLNSNTLAHLNMLPFVKQFDDCVSLRVIH